MSLGMNIFLTSDIILTYLLLIYLTHEIPTQAETRIQFDIRNSLKTSTLARIYEATHNVCQVKSKAGKQVISEIEKVAYWPYFALARLKVIRTVSIFFKSKY